MTQQTHTVEKIGGTSMSRSEELLSSVLVGERRADALYNRIFVVSAYGGMTDALLEHKKTGEPGVYALFSSAESGWKWSDALTATASLMVDKNAEVFDDQSSREQADKFILERIEGVRSCLMDLSRLCSFGHFQLEAHLLTVREMLAALGEAQSAFNTALLLNRKGIRARFVDLTGWRQTAERPLDEHIARQFDGIDLTNELPIVTGYAKCSEQLMKTYDRGYSEVTLSRVAQVTGAREAIIHKEFHLSSADPKLVGAERVQVIGQTNYDVADQLSNMDMEAIHPRAAKSLRQAGIPLRVTNAFDPDHPGTVITGDLEPKARGAEIVTGLKGVFALEFHDQDMVGVKGYDAKILEALTRHKVRIISKTSNANTITHYLKGSMKAIKRVEVFLKETFPTAATTLHKLAIVSAIGSDLRGSKALSRAILALEDADVEPIGLIDTARKVDIQILVAENDFETAIIALHAALVEERAKPVPVDIRRVA